MKIALKVREPFHLDDVMRYPGEILSDVDAEKVKQEPELERRCTRIHLDDEIVVPVQPTDVKSETTEGATPADKRATAPTRARH